MARMPVDQVQLIDFADAEPQIGMGFNSLTLVFPGADLLPRGARSYGKRAVGHGARWRQRRGIVTSHF